MQGRSPCDTASMDGSAHLKGGDGIGSSQQQQAGGAAKRHSQQVEHGEGRRGSAELSSTGREAAGKEFSLAGRQSSATTTAYEAGPSAGLTPRAPLISGSETMTVHSRSPFDAAALQSCAVQPSETNALDHLTDQGDILGDPLESRDVLVGSSQLAPGVSISNWRRWDSSPEAMRKQHGMIMDDSAREVDSPVEPETLEKRRQTTGSSAKLADPQSASFKQHKDKSQKEKLHSDRGYGSRSEHLTRAQAEFLSQHARATAPHKGSGSKGHGLFLRQGASFPGTGREKSDRYDSLRSLEPRKDRRMDSHERVWLWLEQAELAMADTQPGEKQQQQQERGDSKSNSRKQSEEVGTLVRKVKPPKPPRNPLQRMFSCFAS